MSGAARVFLGGLVACSAALVAGSCKVFDFPDGTCEATGLVAALPEPARAECVKCLELKGSCDPVGRCSDDPDDCSARVRRAHTCILDAGRQAAKNEQACTSTELGQNAAAVAAYGAMRASCGKACGLPICRVDTSARQVGSPLCDKCLTGACCEELNECYGDRTCKLIVECIIVECVQELASGATPVQDERCSETSAADAGAFDPNSPLCTERCIGRFADHPQQTNPVRGKRPECLALKIRTCAVEARCGELCSEDAGALDGGDAGD